jgi:hypothetical protein
MKWHSLCWIIAGVAGSCSPRQPHHLPDSAYYQQQEAAVLAAVSGQIMTHQFSFAPTTKKDTIDIYGFLAFPTRLQKQEISRVMRDHNLTAEFVELLHDTINGSQAHRSVSNLPISKLEKSVAFTPRYISSSREAHPTYRLSRVVFNQDFTKAYFQLTWEDPAGGVKQYVLCQREGSKWTIKALDLWNSFKI